jgi:hypothetical protein
MASGVGTPTVTTTEFITRHYINNGEYTPTDFESFKEQFMVHASKHFIEPHILLEPEVSDEFIIDFLLKYKI